MMNLECIIKVYTNKAQGEKGVFTWRIRQKIRKTIRV